jgi:gamma-glutamylcyclotransferase (GGCT)/AIG2-like uncharacterized protein YtfP
MSAKPPPAESAPRLFVYGSLRAGETGEMAALLHRHARHLGAGTIRAGLYAVSWYSIAAPCDELDAVVHGDVFELDAAAAGEVLAALDAYEGSEFRRTAVEVRMEDETSVAAEAYLCAASVAGLRRIEHGDWRRERDAAARDPLARRADLG